MRCILVAAGVVVLAVGAVTIMQSVHVTFRWGEDAMFGARHITLKPRSDILPLGFEVAGPRGSPLAPGPELTLRVCGTAGLAGMHGGLPVI